MSILIFFLVLFVLILVHEWGHFIAAKKTGMRVDEFGIGFPPKLFGIQKGETEYTFNALPIGGFVRIFGENPALLEDTVGDKARAFGSRPYWAQAVVLVAGVTMNVIFAWALFMVAFMVGVPTAVDEATAGPEAKLYIAAILPDSPLAGKLPAQSQVLKISVEDGAEITNPNQTSFRDFIQAEAGTEVEISYLYGDESGVATVIPQAGLIPGEEERVAIGVSLTMLETKSYSFGGAIIASFEATWNGLVSITVGLTTLLTQSIMGTADFSQVAGPVGIVGMVGDAADFGIIALLTFTAMISLNLAVINMLPIPALDGGRLLFVAIEAITRRPINPVWMSRVNLIGFAALMLLMIIVTWNDIAKLF